MEDLEAFFDAASGNDAGTTRVRVPLTEDQEAGLQHALDMLTEEERTFILANYRDELSKTEIAAANGTSIGRVEMMVKRALMKMAHPAVFYQIQYGVRGCRVVQATREVEEKEQWIAEKEQELQEREARLNTFDVVSEKLYGRISIYQMEHVDGAAVRSIAEEGVRTADQFVRKLARDPLWLLELRNISNETREQIFLAYGQMLHRIRDAIRENQIG